MHASNEFIKAAPELKLQKRLDYGRLMAGVWLDDKTVLFATRAGLWEWVPETGETSLFLDSGARLLALHRASGWLALALETPTRSVVLLSTSEPGMQKKLVDGVKTQIHTLVFSDDGTRLAVGFGDGHLRVWDVQSGNELLSLMHPEGGSAFKGNPEAAAFSADGKWIATADRDQSLWLWNAETGQMAGEWNLPMRASRLEFFKDSSKLCIALEFPGGMTAREDRFLVVFDVQSGQICHSIDTPTQEDWLLKMAASPSGLDAFHCIH